MAVHPGFIVLGGIIAASFMARAGIDVSNQPIPPNIAYAKATVKDPIPVDAIRSTYAFNFGAIVGRSIGRAARG